MVYIQDDPGRGQERDFNVPDTPAERITHLLAIFSSLVFTLASGAYLLTDGDKELKMMLALGTGGLFLISLVAFFSVIMMDRE